MNDHIHNLSSIENATAYIILRTARLLRFNLAKTMGEHGISPEQWFILFKLYERPGRSQKELADPNLNDHPNITRMVDTLESSGFLIRTQDPADRRRHLLYLTDKGHTFMETMRPTIVKERQKLFSGISDAEIDQLLSILARIDQNVVG